jgi:hypothetical protein
MIQYAHKGSAFEGWFNLKAYTTLEKAETALDDEKMMNGNDYKYCINSYKIEA